MWKRARYDQVVAKHNWNGKVKYGLELVFGDRIEIIAECTNWYSGFKIDKPNVIGIFPKSYVHLKDVTETDPFRSECSQVLNEWLRVYKRKFANGERPDLLVNAMKLLLKLLQELPNARHPNDIMEIKRTIIRNIDRENSRLKLDLIPRDDLNVAVDLNSRSIRILKILHEKGSQKSKFQEIIQNEIRKKVQPFHIFICMKKFGYQINGDVIVYFHLCDEKLKQISERFSITVSWTENSKNQPSNCCVFTELGRRERASNIYLAATALKIEAIRPESGDESEQCHRRSFGAGAKEISSFIDTTGNIIDMHGLGMVKADGFLELFRSDDKSFHKIHDMLINKAPHRCSANYFPIQEGSKGMEISVQFLHGDLNEVKKRYASLFDMAMETRNVSFPDILMPGHGRDDLYLSLNRAELERQGLSHRNVEVVVSVFDADGELIPKCLWGSSANESGASQYTSRIVHHNNMPVWNETIRLDLRVLKCEEAHIRFEFRHRSTHKKGNSQLFAFSFIRLMTFSDTAIGDGMHKLYVYKCDDPNRLIGTPYAILKCSEDDPLMRIVNKFPTPATKFRMSRKKYFYVGSKLISMKYTQNKDIVAVIKWRKHPGRVQDALQQLADVHDGELFKFLQHVLHALWNGLFSTGDGQPTEYTSSVFQVLISIFSLLQTSKFRNFKPVLDKYIECQFSAALAHNQLIRCCQSVAEHIANSDSNLLSKYCDSFEYMVKLIVRSRELYKLSRRRVPDDTFCADLFNLFSSLSKMLTRTLKVAICGSTDPVMWPQMSLIRAMGVILEQLRGHLHTSDICIIIDNVFSAINLPVIMQAKHQAIIDIMNGKLFKDSMLRSTILAVAIEHFRIQSYSLDEVQIWANVWDNVAHNLYQVSANDIITVSNYFNQDLSWLCRHILFDLCDTIWMIIEVGDFKETLSSLMTVLLGILQLWKETHYVNLFAEFEGKGELRRFVRTFAMVFNELFKNDWQPVFSSNWIYMKLAANKIISQALNGLVEFYGLTTLKTTFDNTILDKYFGLVMAFITQPCLQIEEYHYAKRCRILDQFDDMRAHVAFRMLSLWSKLDDHKLDFNPLMIDRFLQLTLIPNVDLQKDAIGAIYDMIKCEQTVHGSFGVSSKQIIQKLDSFFNENKTDDKYRELFEKVMLEKLQSDNPPWIESGLSFVESLNQLLEIILEHRLVGEKESNHKRIACIGEILNYYKNDANQKEMYLRYLNILHPLHRLNGDYIEAGLTLKRYADQLSWENGSLSTEIDQPEWEIKVNLCKQALECFDKGQCWEMGFPLFEDLGQFFTTKRLDIESWEQTRKMHKQFMENISTGVRAHIQYFRVGLFGMGFSNFVRNRQFIYRGNYHENVGNFIERLQTYFPNAQNLGNETIIPDPSIFQNKGQFMQISCVYPIFDETYHSMSIPGKSIPYYYQINNIKRFRLDLPDRESRPKDEQSQFKSWLNRAILETSEPLPNILRWSEVVNSQIQKVSPVEIACEFMQKTINEFKSVIKGCQGPRSKDKLKLLSMELQGKLCAPVSGGLNKYQDAFLSDKYVRSEEGKSQSHHIRRLNDLMFSLVPAFKEALDLHKRLTTEIELNALLNERLNEMQEKLRASTLLLPTINKPSPGVPFELCHKKMNDDEKTVTNTSVPPIPLRQLKYEPIGITARNSFNELLSNIILRPGHPSCSDRLSYTSTRRTERQEEIFVNIQNVRSTSNSRASNLYIKLH